MSKTPLELLAPAGTMDIGKAAIDHGADAVYIGAPQFSARAQAGNDIADIAELVGYAHQFHARVYVAFNTILTDEELPAARQIIQSIHETGVDGLIIQDMGLLELDLPPFPLIASTQTHNTTPEKIAFLEAVGFQRAILARELSLEDIRAIRARTSNIALEAFVHGALCVSFSGQCYMSQMIAGRSGNRGVCAQPCRHRYTLIDGDGKVLLEDKHLLSIKDMNRIDHLAELAEAGITSFKIEGRYKEMDYVKNITAAYRLALDRLIVADTRYCKASSGTCAFGFRPDPAKSFNRGFTPYFLSGSREKIGAMDSPKSMGERIGPIESIDRNWFRIRHHDLHNGDGLCFFTKENILSGCRVNRVDGDTIYPNTMKDLTLGSVVYRNFEKEFTYTLKQSIRCRTIEIEMIFHQEPDRIRLTAIDEDGIRVEVMEEADFEPARDPERAKANIEKQLSRTGDTPYQVKTVTIKPEAPGFLPLSALNDLRRKILTDLTHARLSQHPREEIWIEPNETPYPETELDYRANVLNSQAQNFYARHGAKVREKALESNPKPAKNQTEGKVLMTTRYCLRYELDACIDKQNRKSEMQLKPPLYISDQKHRYQLEFDCKTCRMKVKAPDQNS